MNQVQKKSPFEINNVRRFIAFRIFFNSRFYYPIFAILFLDFGLTLSQFALLNAAWAASIVIFEVPSGALADIIGRRKLMTAAGVLMVIELAILCFAPRGNPDLLFAVFMVNRVLSGAAEAAASGADEAIAYDSLKAEGDPEDWGRVLERMMRLESMTRIFAMSLGAAVYDPALMQIVADFLGLNITLTQDITLRFPLFLTMGMALATLYTVFKFEETPGAAIGNGLKEDGVLKTSINAFKLTFEAGGWILKTPFAFMIILSGLLFDHATRMLGTMNSQYFRLIDIPEAAFGVIGSTRSLFGLFIPALALIMVHRFSPRFNITVMAFFTFIGFYAMTFFFPIWGLIPAFLLSAVMYFVSFFTSRYLNRITKSSRRATVLSFKGLSFNLAYGLIGVFYALLLAHLRQGAADINAGDVSDQVFIESVAWFPWYFLAAFALVAGFGAYMMRNSDEHKTPLG